jgi:hypothetical protein
MNFDKPLDVPPVNNTLRVPCSECSRTEADDGPYIARSEVSCPQDTAPETYTVYNSLGLKPVNSAESLDESC